MDSAPSFLQMVGTTLTIVGFVVGGATAYLRLFVSNSNGQLKESIRADIAAAFASKDSIEDLRRRVGDLEAVGRNTR